MADRVLIVGGGIGGVAAAIALKRIGVDAVVFERIPELTEVGAGLSLWSNAVHALKALGLADSVVDAGSALEDVVTMTSGGRHLSRMAIGEMGRSSGAPSICCHRADLLDVLRRGLTGDQMRTGAECARFEQTEERVTVHLEDGRSEQGTLLVGSDGINSTVRRQLMGQSEPRQAGYICWRGMVDLEHEDLPPGRALAVLGKGSQIGVMRCGPGRLYWFATRNDPVDGPDIRLGRKNEVLAAFDGWCPPVQPVIEATDERAILRNDIADRPPHWPWGQGRVTLLGDAIHSTTPNLGQGACQAIESAVVLADAVSRRGLTPAALRDYERRRRARTARVTRRSWSLGRILQWQRPSAVAARNAMLRSGLLARRQRRTIERLLDVDLPDLEIARDGPPRH